MTYRGSAGPLLCRTHSGSHRIIFSGSLPSTHTHTHWLTTSSPFISSYREKEKKNKRMPLILGQQLFDALNEEGWGGEGRQ